ncbi:hypothetical protein Vi05172_g4018 [Venturia inaequalis]|nr:hypothetical protein Vi05172_g4018 [Venturia inaequalis]
MTNASSNRGSVHSHSHIHIHCARKRKPKYWKQQPRPLPPSLLLNQKANKPPSPKQPSSSLQTNNYKHITATYQQQSSQRQRFTQVLPPPIHTYDIYGLHTYLPTYLRDNGTANHFFVDFEHDGYYEGA